MNIVSTLVANRRILRQIESLECHNATRCSIYEYSEDIEYHVLGSRTLTFSFWGLTYLLQWKVGQSNAQLHDFLADPPCFRYIYIDPSTLLSFRTEPLVDWCAGSVTFSRGTRRAFCRTNAGRRVADEFRLEKNHVLQHQFSTYQPQEGADWCWLMVVGDWWPSIEFFFHWFISTFQPLCFVFSLHLYFFRIFCCMFCLVSSWLSGIWSLVEAGSLVPEARAHDNT